MNTTKKTILIIGAILSILGAVLALIFAAIFRSIPMSTIIESMEVTEEMTEADIELTANLTLSFMKIIATCLALSSLLKIAFGIVVLVYAIKGKTSKWPIVTLLVVSILCGFGLITTVLMIVALCLKDEKKEPDQQVPPETPSNDNVDAIEL